MSKAGEWRLCKDVWISQKAVLPGVWRRRDGGCLVKCCLIDARTGRRKEIFKSLPEADPATALKWLNEEKARIRGGSTPAEVPKTRFCEFAASLFERKVKLGEIRSAAGRNKWVHVLKHLIEGTTGKKSK